ncbi:MAG: DUF1622 domain-containing protein [Candidatus Altimarinota bacterium]
MTHWAREFFEAAALILEFLGVFVIFCGVIREEIARSILLGLEILIAVDIIKTVTTDLALTSVLTLGLIIIIRTLLSVSLEWEIEKKFLWQK